MMEAISLLEAQLKQSKRKYLAGDRPSIADLLYFFEMTNLILYEIPFDHFTHVFAWFNRVLEVPEVKNLTDTWQDVASGLKEMFKSIPIVDDSKL